jgi:uncharacterized membrane protein
VVSERRIGNVGRTSRWTASVAVGLLLALIAVLPARYSVLPAWIRQPTLALVCIFAILSALSRTNASTRPFAHLATVALVGLFTVVFIVALGSLVARLFERGAQLTGASVLSTSVALWSTNIVVFALWYWLVDRGGPDRRESAAPGPLDLIFPQNSARELFPTAWTPRFADYLFLAFVTSTAFSPADTLPVSRRAKMLMMAQAVLSLVTVVVLVARAINILD